ncbi:MAG: methyltransferase domain-containing protein [Candidatus Omnitrophica bacterium]|nr:methyltransferase domain-containing protein [Candidatus Omnitrophota bacterium]
MKKNKTLTRDWFRRWSKEYDQTLGKISFHRDLLDLMVKNSNVKDGYNILDIGCGTGLLSLKFLQKANCFVTGVDSSGEMIAIFQDKIRKLNLGDKVSLHLMDAASLKFKKEAFDQVVSSVTLHHLKDKLSAIKTVFNILNKNGLFIIGEIDMDTTGKFTDIRRLKRILKVLEQEWIPALKDAGVEAFSKMFENGKKHILNQGEYCISLAQWSGICRRAGFKSVAIKKLGRYPAFGIVIAKKS